MMLAKGGKVIITATVQLVNISDDFIGFDFVLVGVFLAAGTFVMSFVGSVRAVVVHYLNDIINKLFST